MTGYFVDMKTDLPGSSFRFCLCSKYSFPRLFQKFSTFFLRPLPLSMLLDISIILSLGVAESESSTRKLVDVSVSKSLGLVGIVCSSLENRRTFFWYRVVVNFSQFKVLVHRTFLR